MHIDVYVPPHEAVKRGSSRSGDIQLTLTDDFLSELSDEEREMLSSFLLKTGNIYLGEPTTESLRDKINREVEKKKESDRKEEKKKAEKKAEREAIRSEVANWLASADPDFSDIVDVSFRYGPDAEISHTRIDIPSDLSDKINELDLHSVYGHVEAGDVIRKLAASEVKAEIERRRDQQRKHVRDQEIAAEKKKAEKERQEKLFRAALDTAVREWGDSLDVERLEEGVLSEKEALRIVRDRVFAPLDNEPRYERLSKTEVFNAGDPDDYSYLAPDSVDFNVFTPDSLTRGQFARLKEIRSKAPEGAECEFRIHEGLIEDNPVITRGSVLVTINWHERKLSREFAG